MINNDMRKLEEKILNSAIPEDTNDSRQSITSNIGKKIKKHAQADPKNLGLKAFIVAGCMVILLLITLIVNTLNSNSNDSGNNNDNKQDALEGFNHLTELQTESEIEKENTVEVNNSEQHHNNTVSSNSDIINSTEVSAPTNNYYIQPAILSAAPTDSLVQIADKVYKLPISMRELEEDGIVMITLGSQPPAEDVTLTPQMRNGCIQIGDNRYTVTLKNGMDCTYHDLTVCEISTKEEGGDIYLFEGITIGNEEASLPQGADRIEQDFAKLYTFYYWGSLNKELYNTSGRCTKVTVSNNTGKVVEVSVFDDATVTGTPN